MSFGCLRCNPKKRKANRTADDYRIEYSVEHVSLAKQTDVVLVAPASANVIGKLANGIVSHFPRGMVGNKTDRVDFFSRWPCGNQLLWQITGPYPYRKKK